jgi:cytochrome c-type biogenesis protein CcmH
VRAPARIVAATAAAAAAFALAFALAAAGQARAAPRVSLPAIERQVMCVSCKIPLDVAQSPQADRERAYIQLLIDRGESEAQIKRALVGQYGPAVLGLPSASGFDLSAYLVPAAVLLALLALLLVLLARWRRRSRSAGPALAAPSLTPAERSRLADELERFDR